MVVPSFDWVAPLPACGAPPVVSGGQVWAHAPEHVEAVEVSASKRDRGLPAASTRNVPSLASVPTAMVAAAGVGVGAVAPATPPVGVVPVVGLLEPHALRATTAP